MSSDPPTPDVEPPVDLATAAAIAGWGREQRLPAALADAVFAEIVGTPAPQLEPVNPVWGAGAALDSTWWRTYAASLAATMVASTRWAPAA